MGSNSDSLVTEATELLDGAKAVARGVARMFYRHDIVVQPEISLRNHRRADLMGIDSKGQIVIVEIKVARGDLLGDRKWTEYLDYCDRFYWALPPEMDASPLEQLDYMPERCGLIVADSYDAEIVRPAATHSLAAARRKVETMRLARRTMLRKSIDDGWLDSVSEDRYG